MHRSCHFFGTTLRKRTIREIDRFTQQVMIEAQIATAQEIRGNQN